MFHDRHTTREVALLTGRIRTEALQLFWAAAVAHARVGTAYLWSRPHVDALFMSPQDARDSGNRMTEGGAHVRSD